MCVTRGAASHRARAECNPSLPQLEGLPICSGFLRHPVVWFLFSTGRACISLLALHGHSLQRPAAASLSNPVVANRRRTPPPCPPSLMLLLNLTTCMSLVVFTMPVLIHKAEAEKRAHAEAQPTLAQNISAVFSLHYYDFCLVVFTLLGIFVSPMFFSIHLLR